MPSFLTNPEVHSVILQGVLFLSVALPVAEKLAAKTANKTDDGVIKFLGQVLSTLLPFLPRIRQGK